MATFKAWTAKTETFENADVSHIIYACANERCCIFSWRSSRAFQCDRGERFENGSLDEERFR